MLLVALMAQAVTRCTSGYEPEVSFSKDRVMIVVECCFVDCWLLLFCCLLSVGCRLSFVVDCSLLVVVVLMFFQWFLLLFLFWFYGNIVTLKELLGKYFTKAPQTMLWYDVAARNQTNHLWEKLRNQLKETYWEQELAADNFSSLLSFRQGSPPDVIKAT